MSEYTLTLHFTAADDGQAARLGEAWAGTMAAEYGTRYGGVTAHAGDDERPGGVLHDAALEDLLATLWQFWDGDTTWWQLTTERKELFADVVDAAHERANADNPGMNLAPVERWWRT